MSGMKRALFFACVALAASARPADAELITWQFTGSIDGVAGDAFGSYTDEIAALFPLGSLVTYELTFDPAWAPEITTDFRSQYSFGPGDPLSYSATLAGSDFDRSPTSGVVFLNVGDGYMSVDTTLSELTIAPSPIAGGATLWYGKGFDVHALIPTSSGYPLPTAFPDPASAEFTLYLQAGRPSCFGCGVDGRVWGHFDSVARVPEPATLAVLGVGLLLTAARLARRRPR